MGDLKPSALSLHIVTFFIFIGFLLVIFELRRFAFIAEVIVALILLVLALIAIFGIYKSSNWAFVLLTLVFAAILVDLAFIFYLITTIDLIFVVTAAIT